MAWQLYNDDIMKYCEAYSKDGQRFQSLLCDPPYNLDTIKKRFGKENSAPAKFGTDGVFARSSRGFMGKEWDNDVAFDPELWSAISRLLCPGAFCMAFSSTRTYHRMATAIEQAGFVIHPMIGHIQAQGFPKATRLRRCECEDEDEQKSITQKTWENNSLSSVPEGEVHSEGLDERDSNSLLLSKLPKQSTLPDKFSPSQAQQIGQEVSRGGVDGGEQSSVEGRSNLLQQTWELQADQVREVSTGVPTDGSQGRVRDGAPLINGSDVGALSGTSGGSPSQEPRPTGQQVRKSRVVSKQQTSQASGAWEICAKCGKPIMRGFAGHRYGLQALKPSFEPICVFQKPFEGRPIDCIKKYGAGALNIEGAKIGDEEVTVNVLEQWSGLGQVQRPDYESTTRNGRYPANVVISGDVDLWYSKFFYCAKASRSERDAGLEDMPDTVFGQSGGAQSKLAQGEEEYLQDSIGLNRIKRVKNPHPTVKPIDLIKHLATLLRPPAKYKSNLLVPFAGSGSEMIGALLAGWNTVIGIEIEKESCEIAVKRIKHWTKEEK